MFNAKLWSAESFFFSWCLKAWHWTLECREHFYCWHSKVQHWTLKAQEHSCSQCFIVWHQTLEHQENECSWSSIVQFKLFEAKSFVAIGHSSSSLVVKTSMLNYGRPRAKMISALQGWTLITLFFTHGAPSLELQAWNSNAKNFKKWPRAKKNSLHFQCLA